MKLKDYLNQFYELSGKASDINRQAAFAGIAIIWIFRITEKNITIIPTELLWPVKLFAIGLAIDLIHYVLSSSIWGIFHRVMEKKNNNEETEIIHNKWLPIPIWILYYAKIASVITEPVNKNETHFVRLNSQFLKPVL